VDVYVLNDVRHIEEPFPLACGEFAFDDETLAKVLAAYSSDVTWQERDAAFYQCFLAEVTTRLPEALLARIRDRVAVVTGLPLTEQMVVTAQRMEPGQHIGVHSDQPLMGYELARLVVQLNRNWKAEYGGAFQLFDSANGAPTRQLESGFNRYACFCLHPESYHAVSEVTHERRSVVFNFWHAANSPALARELTARLGNVRFSDLPVALAAQRDEAEASLAEEVTYRASLVACLLHHWGFGEETLVNGYSRSIGRTPLRVLRPDEAASWQLADWLAFLYREHFDLARWRALHERLSGVTPSPRLQKLWELALPR